jgi:hypothetical protein
MTVKYKYSGTTLYLTLWWSVLDESEITEDTLAVADYSSKIENITELCLGEIVLKDITGKYYGSITVKHGRLGYQLLPVIIDISAFLCMGACSAEHNSHAHSWFNGHKGFSTIGEAKEWMLTQVNKLFSTSDHNNLY